MKSTDYGSHSNLIEIENIERFKEERKKIDESFSFHFMKIYCC